MLTDTHCHLDFNKFDEDRQAVLQRALDAGIGRILIPALDWESCLAVVRLAGSHPCLFAAVGFHPTDAEKWQEASYEKLKSLITEVQEQTLTFVPKIAAILGILMLLGPWMFTSLAEFTARLFERIPDGRITRRRAIELFVMNFQLLFLVFVRVIAMIEVAPLLSSDAIPQEAKIGLGLFVSAMALPYVVDIGYSHGVRDARPFRTPSCSYAND